MVMEVMLLREGWVRCAKVQNSVEGEFWKVV